MKKIHWTKTFKALVLVIFFQSMSICTIKKSLQKFQICFNQAQSNLEVPSKVEWNNFFVNCNTCLRKLNILMKENFNIL
jgi:Na+(H+)/acetate symporter ActP